MTSYGKKVAPGGSDPPMKQEQAGTVDASSLAAESTRAGGEFASNPGQKRSQGTAGGTPSDEEFQSSTTGAAATIDKSTSASLESAQMNSPGGHGGGGGGGGLPAKSTTTAASSSSSSSSSHGKKNRNNEFSTPEGQGAQAPSYVENVLHPRGASGPHGKNLHEGGFEGSGTDGGPLPEPGSEQDPGRAAFRGLAASGGSSGGGGAERGQRYSELGSDENA